MRWPSAGVELGLTQDLDWFVESCLPMASSESSIHSFVVRLWREMPAGEGGEAQWRGRIIHVASGAHRFFDDLQEMQDFIRQYQTAASPPNRQVTPSKPLLTAGRWRRWWRRLV